MRVHVIRQRALFDDEQPMANPELPKDVRDEVLQLLTQWLHSLSQSMIRESRDEQDRQ